MIPCECRDAGARTCRVGGEVAEREAVTWRPSARAVYVVSYRCRRRLRLAGLKARLARRPAPKRELDVDAIAARRRAALGAAS